MSTIKDFESGLRSPHAANLARIRTVFEQAGLVVSDTGISTAADVLDRFMRIERPTTEQGADAILAAMRLAQAGGRNPEMSEGARKIVRSYLKALGEITDEDE